MFCVVDLGFVYTDFNGLKTRLNYCCCQLVSFLSGSRWVLSYKILFLIPYLVNLSWILSFAYVYLRGTSILKSLK